MLPRLYTDLAPWWTLLSPPESYIEDARLVHGLLCQALGRAPASLLELGCGGGTLASWLPPELALVLSDLSPEMLALAAARNPRAETVAADLRTLRLGRRFDSVLVHDALMYLLTEEDVAAALATARAHLEPGGALLLIPDFTAESVYPGTDAGGGEDESGRAARLLEWRWDPDPDDHLFQVEMALLLREADGTVTSVHDQHTMAAHPTETWFRLIKEAGFRPVAADLLAVQTESGIGEVFLAVAE